MFCHFRRGVHHDKVSLRGHVARRLPDRFPQGREAAAEEPRLHAGGGADSRAGHRRHERYLQRLALHRLAAVAVPEPRAIGLGAGSEPDQRSHPAAHDRGARSLAQTEPVAAQRRHRHHGSRRHVRYRTCRRDTHQPRRHCARHAIHLGRAANPRTVVRARRGHRRRRYGRHARDQLRALAELLQRRSERRRQDHPRLGRDVGTDHHRRDAAGLLGPSVDGQSQRLVRVQRRSVSGRAVADDRASQARRRPRPGRGGAHGDQPPTSRRPRHAAPTPRIGESACSRCTKCSPPTTRTRCTFFSAPSGSCC